MRLEEAELLLKKRKYGGAYYLIGYSVECTLKARIAKQTKKNEFPDKKKVSDSWTHDLKTLLRVSGLKPKMETEEKNGSNVWLYWNTLLLWKTESRYRIGIKKGEALGMFEAASDANSGILKWLDRQ